MDGRFLQPTATISPEIVGREGYAFEVNLPGEIAGFLRGKAEDTPYDFKKLSSLVQDIPSGLSAKMERRKKTVDYMESSAIIPWVEAIISEKFKNVLETTGVNKSEYLLKEINILGQDKPYYILFIPELGWDAIDYEDSVFTDTVLDEDVGIRYYRFSSMEEFLKASKTHVYSAYRIVLDKKYEDFDVIHLRVAGTYFSPRLQKAIESNGIVGVAYFKRRSDFFVQLDFK